MLLASLDCRRTRSGNREHLAAQAWLGGPYEARRQAAGRKRTDSEIRTITSRWLSNTLARAVLVIETRGWLGVEELSRHAE